MVFDATHIFNRSQRFERLADPAQRKISGSVGANLVFALFPTATEIRANTRFAPTFVQQNNPMQMIRHDHKFINRHTHKPSRQQPPRLFNLSTSLVQHHIVLNDSAEQAFPSLYAQGHEIGPGRGIIKFPQPDGPAMVNVRIIDHTPSRPVSRMRGGEPRVRLLSAV